MAEKRYMLTNETLTVTVSNIGAQIKSIKNQDDREYMWSGDPAVWNRTAPIMFPICGGLRDDKFTYEAKPIRSPSTALCCFANSTARSTPKTLSRL